MGSPHLETAQFGDPEFLGPAESRGSASCVGDKPLKYQDALMGQRAHKDCWPGKHKSTLQRKD